MNHQQDWQSFLIIRNAESPSPRQYLWNSVSRRIVLGLQGKNTCPSYPGKLPNTIRNDILNIYVIPHGAFYIFNMASKMAAKMLKKISFITHNTRPIDLHVLWPIEKCK